MKKVILILISALFAFNSQVHAALVKDDCSYTFTFDAEPNEVVTMIVVEKGKDFADENVTAIREGRAGENGIEFKFDIKKMKAFEGDYTLYVMNNSNDIKEEIDFTHASDSSISVAESWLDGVSDAESIYQMLNETGEYRTAFKAMGMKLGFYDGMSDSDKVKALKMFIDEKVSGDDFSKTMNRCIGTVAVNGNYKKEDALSCFEPFFEETGFSNIEDEKLKAWITELVGGEYTSTDELDTRYNELCILYKFNKARFSEFSKLFDKYAEKLGIKEKDAYKNYAALSSEKKSEVGKVLVGVLGSNPSETADSLSYTLNEACKKVIGTKTNTSGGGVKFSNRDSSSGVIVSGGLTESDYSADSQIKPDGMYTDLGSVPWSETAVSALTKKGVVSGDGNGRFRPDDLVTREEFLKMLVVAIGALNGQASSDFTDTDKSAWYYKYISSAYEAGIIFGLPGGAFGVGKKITRQEMAVMTARALRIYRKVSQIKEDNEFSDSGEIADWAKDDIALLYRAGIISGFEDGSYKPLSGSTRAQAAVVVYNLVK